MSLDPDKMNHPPPNPVPPDPLAASLTRLEPAPAALNRDRLMFEAGAESRRSVIRLWQLTAGLMAAVGFFAGRYYRPLTAPVIHVERAADPAPAPESELAAPQPAPPVGSEHSQATPRFEPRRDVFGFMQIRNRVLAGGLGLLPDPGRQSAPGQFEPDQPGTTVR